MRFKRMFSGSLGIIFITLSSHQALAQGEFFPYPDNPVLWGESGEWDAGRAAAPFVLREGGMHYIWYAGGSTNGWPSPPRGIGYATSLDGKDWVKYTRNILGRGTSGSWDSEGISGPSVIKLGNIYYMAYAGYNGFFWRIGIAWSLDRTTWYKSNANPIFNIGAYGEWDDNGVLDPMVIFDGKEYKLYYTGDDGTTTTRIGLATSTDGLNWTRAQNNPVLTEGPSGWDWMGVASPFVFFDGLYYYMWYSGYAGINNDNIPHYEIGLAISRDGYNWVKVDSVNPVVERGEIYYGNFAVGDPSVVQIQDIFEIWFTGVPQLPEFTPTSICLSRSVPLWLDVTPSTTEIPAGEYLDLTITIRNTSPDTVSLQLWSNVTLPNGQPYSGNPVLGPEDIELGPWPFETFTQNFSLYVPAQAPPAPGYTLWTGVGNHPDDYWDISWFEFEILY